MIEHNLSRKGPGGTNPLRSWPYRSFLGSLTSGEREGLLALGTERVYPPRTNILRQGADGKVVVLIANGIAKVNIVSDTGNEILVGIRGAGELIGEMAPLSGESRSASAVAANKVDARVIKADLFLGYLNRSPGVASRLAQMVADRLRTANRHRLELSSYAAEGRIARVLSEIALAHGHPEGTALRIGPEITQADVASLSSSSVRTVEKALQVFEQEDLVVRKRRNLVVLNPEKLAARPKDFPIIPS